MHCPNLELCAQTVKHYLNESITPKKCLIYKCKQNEMAWTELNRNEKGFSIVEFQKQINCLKAIYSSY